MHAHTCLSLCTFLDSVDASSDPLQQRLELIDFSCALDLSEVESAATFKGRGRCTYPCPEVSMRANDSFLF